MWDQRIHSTALFRWPLSSIELVCDPIDELTSARTGDCASVCAWPNASGLMQRKFDCEPILITRYGVILEQKNALFGDSTAHNFWRQPFQTKCCMGKFCSWKRRTSLPYEFLSETAVFKSYVVFSFEVGLNGFTWVRTCLKYLEVAEGETDLFTKER